MIDVKAAVIAAKAFLEEMYPKASAIRLEEINSDDNMPFVRLGPEYWAITLSFVNPEDYEVLEQLGIANDSIKKRSYKVFRVNKSNGEVISMAIRQGINA